ncbi:MAG: Polyphosphate kinase 2 (PPK2) [Verrucomicrobia bacterium ADurb.Bin474]|nr:MAG: Polyphosphate kinase 2 (PPK2) [Verrucomicrobia bacterium ADurb.Bin474]
MPERGRIGIFNRSYYEDVLVVKVDPKVFAGQKIPQAFMEDPKFWKDRYKDINRFEDYMTRQGTHIIKFFLHLSKEEQRQRFLSRIDEPDKNWKLSPYDVEVRARWDDYQEVYEDCLKKTSTKKAPWYCIPADDKQNARILVSHIIVESLRKLPVDYPQVDDAHRQRLKESREQLESEA